MFKKVLGFLGLLLICSISQASLLISNALELDIQNRDLLEQQNITESILPPSMIKRLRDKTPPNGYQLTTIDTDEHIAGSSNRKGLININKKLLANSEKTIRTLIHEWAHQYDFINWQNPSLENHIAYCQSMKVNRGTPDDLTHGACDLFYDIQTSISTNPLFMEIGGWPLKYYSSGYRIKQTNFTNRSPDIYEQRSSAEMFAVNMEYFLTDPDYQCRRPSLYLFLSLHFDHKPFKTKNCHDFMKIVDPQFSKIEHALASIDTKRIYQIHYLLASRGNDITSKFGHSMFRIVMCAPTTKFGPDCLKNINHHIVLSFRAFVDTPEISSIAGLRGKYSSTLFFLPFIKVLDEYTKTELRDLESYPLKLNSEQIESFVTRAIETHWSYSGKYYFLTNNCAVESMNLLRSGTFIPVLLNEGSRTPYGLRKDLAKAGLLDIKLTENRDLAKSQGYLFTSHEENLIKAQDVLYSVTKNSKTKNYKKWIELNPKDRRTIFEKYLPSEKSAKIKYSAAALLLEGHAEKVSASSISGKVYKLLKSKNLPDAIAATLDKIVTLQNGLAAIGIQLTSPSQISAIGYGLPSKEESASMISRLESLTTEQSSKRNEITKLLASLFSIEDQEASVVTSENKVFFTKTLLIKEN